MVFDDLPGRVSEAPVERIAPLEVLYEFDGPRIFSLSSRDGNLLLAYLCDQAKGGLNFLLAPSSVRSIERLKSGEISVREAIDQAWVWIVSCDQQWKILGSKSSSFDELPDAVLPREGTPLLPEHIPLLVTKQIGPSLTPGKIPISVVRRAVDGDPEGAKGPTVAMNDARPASVARQRVIKFLGCHETKKPLYRRSASSQA